MSVSSVTLAMRALMGIAHSLSNSYALRMSTPKVVPLERGRRSTIQKTVTRNVKLLMALRDLTRADIGAVIGLSAQSIGHKFTGRAKWTLDEVDLLSVFAGEHWPVYRFFENPEPGGPSNGLPRLDSNQKPSDFVARRRAKRVSWSFPLRAVS